MDYLLDYVPEFLYQRCGNPRVIDIVPKHLIGDCPSNRFVHHPIECDSDRSRPSRTLNITRLHDHDP